MSHALRRKLHAWELQHLREHVEDLRAQVDALQTQRDELQRRLDWAEGCADAWRDDALRAIEDVGCAPGLTLAGQVIPLPKGSIHEQL